MPSPKPWALTAPADTYWGIHTALAPAVHRGPIPPPRVPGGFTDEEVWRRTAPAVHADQELGLRGLLESAVAKIL
ncbi:hypothetical protein [Streptomyces sp. NBC_00076]|uniref:hypothetical protein n=1 Tax=Streptomyces sp. NBC_00076 TaxID=2975642 RepID=UPI003247B554